MDLTKFKILCKDCKDSPDMSILIDKGYITLKCTKCNNSEILKIGKQDKGVTE